MEKLAELLTAMTGYLVDHPEAVNVVINTSNKDALTTFEVYVVPGELGQAIGRDGRLANAMRLIIKSAARKHDSRVLVEFKDATI